MTVTARRIAQELGISEASVSLALNQRPGVSDKTRTRVMECAKALGYDFTRVRSRAPKTQETAICLVQHAQSILGDQPFFTDVLQGIERASMESGATLMHVTIPYGQDLGTLVSRMTERGASGFLVMATDLDMDAWRTYERLDVPVVMLDAFEPQAALSCVTINNRQGAAQATEALLRERRGCPGYLASRTRIRNFDERADGFYQAVRRWSYSSSLAQAHQFSTIVEAAEREFSELLNQGLEVQHGYFAECDQIAVGAVRALLAHGYRVPEDVSVVGFDDIDLARYLEPALTTVHVPKEYLGRTALSRLLTLMDEQGHEHVRMEVGTSLVRRSTTLAM